MRDLISRQAAIDIEGLDEEIRCEICRNPIRTNRGCDGNCTYDEKLYEKIMQMLDRRIKHVPPAQPERKKGKWHRRFYPQIEMMVCSECQEEFSYDAETGIRDYNYCPNCGADMRGGDA